jgi:hypothetical protein
MTAGDDFKRQVQDQAKGWWASLQHDLESLAATSKGEPVDSVIPKVQAAVDKSPFDVGESGVRQLAESMCATGKIEVAPLEF